MSNFGAYEVGNPTAFGDAKWLLLLLREPRCTADDADRDSDGGTAAMKMIGAR